MTDQLALFDGPGSDRGALDELFRLTGAYRTSGPYLRLLDAIGRFVDYSAYNAALVLVQNPKASRVATVDKWKKEFGRRPTDWARPLVMLRPFGPVMFVYDAAETQPIGRDFDPLEEWGRWSQVQTDLNPAAVQALFETLRTSSFGEGVGIVDDPDLNFLQGGSIRAVMGAERSRLPARLASVSYLVCLNADHRVERQVATLAHELGHLFCGHLPKAEPDLWWTERRATTGGPLDLKTREFEAESVAYLVCRRFGLKTASERYLAGYAGDEGIELPPFSFDAILDAVKYVETMGESSFEPRRKPKKAQAAP